MPITPKISHRSSASNLTFSFKLNTSTRTGVVVTIKLGGSRKGSVYRFLDMEVDGETVGIEAMIGITLN